jgi:predicted dehydrogenase
MATRISRRNFLQSSISTVALGALGSRSIVASAQSPTGQETQSSPSPKTSFGIIGVGMQGSSLLRHAVALPNTKCVAAADLYDERHVLAKEIAGQDIQTTRRYQDLLDNKNIDCLIVATPDHWHKQIVIDALRAGKDVYCEKPMSHSVTEGVEMVKALQATDRILQIGSQVTSAASFIKAKELIAGGAIGEVSLAELTLGRNDPTGAWEYPPPPGLSTDNLDWTTWLGSNPTRPLDPYIFARWRAWPEYGSGVAGDLMVHLITGMQFVLGLTQMPDRASSSGGVFRWKDGRVMPDLQVASFEYPGLIVSIRVTQDTETPSISRFMGSRGILEIASNQVNIAPQPGIDLKPSYYDASYPQAMRTAYEKQWHVDNDAKVAKFATSEKQTFSFAAEDITTRHLQVFFNAVQTRQPVVEDAVFGHHAAAACHMANQSYFKRAPVTKESAV